MAKAYQIKLDLPNLGKGVPVEIPGLGVFENGTTTTLSADQVATFRTVHRVDKGKVDDKGSYVSDWQLGPSPADANFQEGITAQEVDATEDKPKQGDGR